MARQVRHASMLRLNTLERVQLQRIQELLLSPLEYSGIESWYRAFSRDLKRLAGADIASAVLGVEGQLHIMSEEVPAPHQQEYPVVIRPLDVRWSMYERHIDLGVWWRDAVWHRHLDEFRQSAYYNEFVVPGRFFDAIGMSCLGAVPGTPPTVTTTATFMLHHAQQTGPQFGTRGTGLLELVRPTFTAAVGAIRQLASRRQALSRTIDELGLAMMLVDADGLRVHQTPLMTHLMGQPEDGPLLSKAIRAVSRACNSVIAQRGTTAATEASVAGSLVQKVITSMGAYQVSGTRVSDVIGTRGGRHEWLVLVAVTVSAATPIPETELRTRYRLTAAQVRVAGLIRENRQVSEIAEALGISTHTVRRHVESIREKLQVHSMRDAGAVLRGERFAEQRLTSR